MTSLGNSTDGLEIGMVVAWTLSANPSDNYLECNGQAVDSTKYPKLYALMHNVPDYRGMFLRGLGGNSANLGILQGDAIRNIVGQIGGPGLGRITIQGDHRPQLYATGPFTTKQLGDGDEGHYGGEGYQINFDASRIVPTAEENRPINKAVRYFIKAK